MPNVSLLSDGTPITYEWLNSLAYAINDLTIDKERSSNIRVEGDTSLSGQDVLVLVGTTNITLAGTSLTATKKITLSPAFAETPSVVLATLSSTSSTTDIPHGTVAVKRSDLASVEFDVRVFKKDDSKQNQFTIQYVAIGKRKAV